MDPRKNFVPRFLPWLLAAGAFMVYWFTLNPWVSLSNLDAVAGVSGWKWQPPVLSPVSFLVTYPLRWLPASLIPLALNLFSAGCAAVTLGLLARSVALLPHDRTEAQRKREHSDFSFLTTRSAWLPPTLAVAICGLQMSFWENATNYTGETFDLLLFAFVIWSLLEYRLDEREGRLFLASAVYGAGLANNYAMVGFFPFFIAAIIWIRGLSFFDPHFLRRMIGYGLLGTTFYLLLPLLAIVSHRVPVTFWDVLKANLSSEYNILKFIFICCLHPTQHFELLSLFLAYLIPVTAVAIRWKPAFGDHSPLGMALTSFLFHIGCAVFLVFTVWMAFGPPFSPRQLGMGVPLLTLYYLGAVSIGYFSGYFLLIFGKAPAARMQPPRPEPLAFLNPAITVAVGVFALVAVVGIIYRNTPPIRAFNDDTFKKYASFATENLPPTGGILLSDDPIHLFLVEAALARDGRLKNFIPLETSPLNWPFYLRLLHREYPKQWPELLSAKQTGQLNPAGLVAVMAMLAKSNAVYYVHPSFGYYFEQFYQEPCGLVYRLKPLPEDTLLVPVPDKNQIAANTAFWSQVKTQALTAIERAVEPPDSTAAPSWGERQLDRFHVPREPNTYAAVVGAYYSRSLNFWGVQLQRAGELTNAASCFNLAKEVNPDNFVAEVNLEVNQNLLAAKSVPLDLARTSSDRFGKYHNWNEVLTANGPFDDPAFCLVEGYGLAHDNGFIRQAVTPFTRVLDFEPGNLTVRLWLAQIYAISHLPDRTLQVLQDPIEHPKKYFLAETNETELNVIAASAYFQKNDVKRGAQLLETEMARHPADNELAYAAVQVYAAHGLYTNALALLNRKVKLDPDNPIWLFNQGYILMQINAYPDAIDALSRLLTIETNNTTARFNRAVACLNNGRLDAAEADYKILQQSLTNSYLIAYGLGEIAWRKHETNEAIRNYEIYLANANTNTDEAAGVTRRLRELKGHSP